MNFITVTFPAVNKNNSLLKNVEAILMSAMYDIKCPIQKTVELDEQTFEAVSNSLLENRAELWEKIGGAWSDAPELENVDYIQMCNSEELTAIFRATCYTPVVEVVESFGGASGRRFYVNTEGYDYARYVGVVTEKNRKEDWFSKPQKTTI